MKNILILILLITHFILPQENKLKNFEDLLLSLKNGNEVRVVVEYNKCKLFIDSLEVNSVNAIGGMPVKTFEYFAKGSIRNKKAYFVFSENVLISHNKYGYVYNYVRFRVFEDNEVEITARYLKPQNFEVVMDETFYCKINDDKNGGGVTFYED